MLTAPTLPCVADKVAVLLAVVSALAVPLPRLAAVAPARSLVLADKLAAPLSPVVEIAAETLWPLLVADEIEMVPCGPAGEPGWLSAALATAAARVSDEAIASGTRTAGAKT